MKSKLAITLVALIITIIVLLILAMVSISLVINNGVLDKAQHGMDKYSEEEELEQIKLAVAAAMLKGNGFLDTENLNRELHERIDENENAEKIEGRWYYKKVIIDENGIVEKNDNLLPKEYQQVEYIELDNNNPCQTYIKTSIEINNISQIILKYGYKDFNSNYNPMVISSININNITNPPWICTNGIKSGNLTISPNIKKEKNLNPTEFNITCESDSNNVLRIGGWSDNLWTPVGKYYYIKIYDNLNNIIFNGIPCYKKNDNNIGLYDTIEKKFFGNNGSGTFVKGKDV